MISQKKHLLLQLLNNLKQLIESIGYFFWFSFHQINGSPGDSGAAKYKSFTGFTVIDFLEFFSVIDGGCMAKWM
jgi:hypothetical protein